MKPVVLLTHAIHERAMQRLREEAEVRVASTYDEDSLCSAIADAAAVIVRMPLSAAVIEAGKSLRAVARHGVGLDYIPVDTCTALGLPVIFTPNANTESVAEHVVGSMIALAHRFIPADRAVKSHQWGKRDGMIGIDLHGRTIGIVGMGRIGSRLANICRVGFSMEVLGYDPFVAAGEIRRRGAEPVELQELLQRSEFVSLHLPATPATRHLLNTETIAAMRHGAYLVNAARGPLIDTAALATALKNGRLLGAALDVLEDEPPKEDNPLLDIDNVLITPHSAALTEEAMLRMGMDASEDVLRVLRGEAPLNCANASALARRESAAS